jgi:uncharacterized membrane protein YeiB
MSVKDKNKTQKKIKTTLVLLWVIFLFSLFVNNKNDDETNHNTQHYPQEVEIAMDSLLEFLDKVDDTLNIFLKDSLKIESYGQKTNTGNK